MDRLNFTHRPASEKDRDNIYDMYMEESANPYLTYDWMEPKEFESIFARLVTTSTLFVVENDAEIIATYRLIPKEYRQAHTYYLGSFTIRKADQGKGYASRILTDINVIAQRQGMIRIELTVDVNNIPAIHSYNKAGYIEEGTIRKSYKRADSNHYFDEVLMAVILPETAPA
jgi:putative acetyltransferase